MSTALLRLFHALPPPLRSAAASARGHYLRHWRYGPETDALVDAALERDRWTPAQWAAWRDERLAFVLHRAATRVPYYRTQWSERRRRGDRASWEVLANWPVLPKATVRAAPAAFLAEDIRTSALFREHTSGTTGTPLTLWWSRATVRAWYALFEARGRRWYGVDRRDRWGILGGQLVVPVAERRPPFWVWNAALRQLYCSSHHLAPDLVPHYLAALRRRRVRHLLGYTSALHALAAGALRSGAPVPDLKVVVTNAEPLLDHERETIARAFGCPVRETYGLAEIVAAASECEAGRLHLWPEAGAVEVREGDAPATAGSTGSLVCTGLLNADMPLIRYVTGDEGALAPAPAGAPCACGRGLPVLAGITGRTDHVLYTRDGRRVGRLDTVFKGGLPLHEAQIVQEALDRVRVRYVPAPGFTDAHARELADAVRARLGDVAVALEAVAAVPRQRSGKRPLAVCALSPEERRAVGAPPAGVAGDTR